MVPRLAAIALSLMLGAVAPCAARSQVQSDEGSWAARAGRALSAGDLKSAQALSREAVAARNAAADGERVPELLRFLLDSGDPEGARRLAEAVLA